MESFFSQSFDEINSLFIKHHENYLGEKTGSLLGETHVSIIKKNLTQINNLIWISCNPIDVKWRGNYFRDRPVNINYVNDVSKKLIQEIKASCRIIDNTNWTLQEVKKYTSDNIHYSKEGMKFIYNEINKILENND